MENSPSSYKRDMKVGGREAEVCLSDCFSILKIREADGNTVTMMSLIWSLYCIINFYFTIISSNSTARLAFDNTLQLNVPLRSSIKPSQNHLRS